LCHEASSATRRTRLAGPINAGGNQVVLTNNTPTSEILSTLSGFVSTAIESGFSSREIELIDRVAEAQDISGEELEAAVRSGIEAAAPEQSRLAKFRDAVMQSAVSGVRCRRSSPLRARFCS